MKKILNKYSESRIIHINFNATIASIVSIFVSAYFVHLTHHITNNNIGIALISYVIDGLIDFSVFAFLHVMIYLHNRIHVNFAKIIVKDITILQAYRFILSPLSAIIAIGGHFLLMNIGLPRTPAFVIAYLAGLLVSRVSHTMYGLRKGIFNPLNFKKRAKK